jgi:hypothetical protein
MQHTNEKLGIDGFSREICCNVKMKFCELMGFLLVWPWLAGKYVASMLHSATEF